MAYEISKLELSDNEKVAIDFYLACNTKIAALRLLRKLDGELRVLSDDGAKKAASKFFAKTTVVDYIERKEKELKARYQNERIVAKETAEEEVNLATATRDKVNQYLIDTLEEVIKNPNSTSSDVISAVNKIADIRNSKEKEDDTDNSAYSKLVHFVVPMQPCDACPNRDELLKENQHYATEDEIKDAFYKDKK